MQQASHELIRRIRPRAQQIFAVVTPTTAEHGMKEKPELEFGSLNDMFAADHETQPVRPCAANRPLLLAVAAAFLKLDGFRSTAWQRDPTSQKSCDHP